jgi:hypothetical protein
MFVAMGEAYSRHPWCGTQNNRTPEGVQPNGALNDAALLHPSGGADVFSTISHGWRGYASPMATNIPPLRGVRLKRSVKI